MFTHLSIPYLDQIVLDYNPQANLRFTDNYLKPNAAYGDAIHYLLVRDVIHNKFALPVEENDYTSNAHMADHLRLLGVDTDGYSDHHCGSLFEYHFAVNDAFQQTYINCWFPRYAHWREHTQGPVILANRMPDLRETPSHYEV